VSSSSPWLRIQAVGARVMPQRLLAPPAARGGAAAIVIIVRLAPLAAAVALAVLGTACADPVSVDISSLTIDFGEIPVGSAAHDEVLVTLRSEGPAFFSASLDPREGPFLIVEPAPEALATEQSFAVPLMFQPVEPGAFLSVLVLEVDAVDAVTRIDVSLRGSAVDTPRDGDRDGVPAEDDCDDADASAFPGATEICDDVDNDCDGALPAEELDLDGDGFAPCRGDCDDGDDTVYPIAPELCDGIDNDCDGDLQEVDADGDGERGCDGDCDDDDPERYTGAPERCNGLDDDCDTVVPLDEEDGDNDTFRVCAGDCLDGNPTVNPGALELCDGLDTDCDLSIPLTEYDDDNDFFLECEECDDEDPTTWPGAAEQCDGADNDCDGVVPADEVDVDQDQFLACVDCDDASDLSYPGATEICDGLDNDCDTVVPADELTDADADTYLLCDDCDDTEASVNPGATEVCDGVDTDCDGSIPGDELVDDDNDGYPLCDDCDDAESTVNPGAAELCDEIDTDCDGTVPGNEIDDDGDGFFECDGLDCDDTDDEVFTGATEECYDAVDNDCDTVVNQGCSCPLWGAVTGGGCANLGEFDCPYVGAQVALDAAALDASCDDVWLQPGTYVESIYVDFSGSLGAAGPASAVVIDGSGSRTFEVNSLRVFEIESVTLTGGSAGEGGGFLAEDAAITLHDVVFDSNVCTGGGEGGAVFCDECTLSITDSTFTGNDCGFGGGSANNNGGAIHLDGGGSSFISGNTFFDNTAGDGGAIWVEAASSTGGVFHVITQNLFQENDTSDTGGGIFESEGGAVAVQGNRVVLSNNVFFANDGAQGGGAVTLSTSAGGATYVTNNVMVYNESANGEGAGVHFDSGVSINGAPNVQNNIVAFNTGWGIYAEATFPSSVDYNDYFQNSSGAAGSGITIIPTQAHSIYVDPLFVAVTDDGNYTNDDFDLQATSQCIDAGNPAPAYNDPDGSLNDMGAYGGPGGAWP